MLRALVLTSNFPRHIYFANMLAKNLDVVGIITEPKNEYFHEQRKAEVVRKHFSRLKVYEDRYLGNYINFPPVPILRIGKAEINSMPTLNWAKEKDIDVVCLFGTGILANSWLHYYKDRIINLHLGYSPRYRGSATLFWPFFNGELNYVGATIHLADEKVDAGKIIKIITPQILPEDNYYDITNRAIKCAIDDFSNTTKDFIEGRIIAQTQNYKDQKFLYKKKDFTQEALTKVMDLYGP